ncbi:ANTAR domain-containing protein [Nocardioides sediminis]|uniref:ANTAR domain-containing protein n=1 Tax=Nocardioides sediminis TaxID=433648 RepID=UPI00131EED55|nr:ANTAR domain-containing protein [Nocardioides sediminis]
MTDTVSDVAVVEQAKGALMLRYGVGSYESLGAMVAWAREAEVTLHEVAHALVKGVCQGHVTPDTRAMVRWLEKRLRSDIVEAGEDAGEGDGARRRSTVVGHLPNQVPRPPATATSTAPRWRYTSAVHAARALGSS